MTETHSPSPFLSSSFSLSLESQATLAFRLISYLKFVGDINGVCGGNRGQMLWALVGRGQRGAAAGGNKLYSILFCISISSSRCLCKVCNTNHSRQAKQQQQQQKQYYTQFLASVRSFFCTFFLSFPTIFLLFFLPLLLPLLLFPCAVNHSKHNALCLKYAHKCCRN